MPNLATLLERHLKTPGRVLYRRHAETGWQDITAGVMEQLVARWQAGYRKAGLQPGDRVAICARNGIQWVAADLAALGLGLVVVPLYVDDNADNVAWCVAHSGARLLILENLRLLTGLQQFLFSPPPVVLMQGRSGNGAVPLPDWLPPAGAFQVIRQAPGALATIVYTSGTTGRPKGVMLSHDNILANVEACRDVVTLHESDSLLSLLPLSHMFERTCGYYLSLGLGVPVAHARGIQQLAEDLASAKPTVIIAVPRVFERFLARVGQALAAAPVKKALFDLVTGAGWRAFRGRPRLGDSLVLRRLRPRVAAAIFARLGGRLRLAVVGGAALEERVARPLIGLGLTLIQGYGLTEASPVIAANREDDNEPLSVGRPLGNLEIRINAEQELLVRGPSVMLGYWDNPEASAAVLKDGWLNTGDRVEQREGRLYIRGRSKDIIVLSNGEKVPPQDIESALLADPVFEQVMLVGEGKPFLVLLAVSQERDEKLLARLAGERLKGFPRWARIRRVIADPEPWTVEAGLLTPTQKIRRRAILERFRDRIEQAYNLTA